MRITDTIARMQYLSVTVDFTSATWNTEASHEVFTVTGDVRMILLPRITESLVGVGMSGQLGLAGATNAFVTTTGVAALLINTAWLTATPAVQYAATSLIDRVVTSGTDVGYELTGAAATDGTIVFHCWWESMSAGSLVVAGAGGTL